MNRRRTHRLGPVQLLHRALDAADLDPHEVEDGVHVDAAVRCGVRVHLVPGDAGLGVIRRRLPHAVGHAFSQYLLLIRQPQVKKKTRSNLIRIRHDEKEKTPPSAAVRAGRGMKEGTYGAQLVGLDGEHPEELLDVRDAVERQLTVERALLADLLQPPHVVAEGGRVVLAVELAAVVAHDERLRHGLEDPAAAVAPPAGDHARADAELAAAHPGRVVRELELAHGHAAAPAPHGVAHLAGEQRALALALLDDAPVELVRGPVVVAVGREAAGDGDQLDAEGVRERRRRLQAGVHVHQDDLQRVAVDVLDPAAREDRQVRRVPERQLQRRPLDRRWMLRRPVCTASIDHGSFTRSRVTLNY
jgi:hypothetical protein